MSTYKRLDDQRITGEPYLEKLSFVKLVSLFPYVVAQALLPEAIQLKNDAFLRQNLFPNIVEDLGNSPVGQRV